MFIAKPFRKIRRVTFTNGAGMFIGHFFIVLFSILITSCATAPAENPWDSVEIPSEAIETPLPCDELPAPLALDEIGKGRIDAMRVCAMANYDIASEHVTQIEEMRDATQNLVEAGQHQRRIAEMFKQMMEEGRRTHFWQRLGWLLLFGGSLAL